MGRDQRHIPEKWRKTRKWGTQLSREETQQQTPTSRKEILGFGDLMLDELIEKRMGRAGSWRGRKWEKEGKKRFKWRGGGFKRLKTYKITQPGQVGLLVNDAMSHRWRSVADATVFHGFHRRCRNYENKWKTYLAWRIHAMVRQYIYLWMLRSDFLQNFLVMCYLQI